MFWALCSFSAVAFLCFGQLCGHNLPLCRYVYQKAYVEFFISPEQFKQLQPQLDSKPSITYMAINSSGEVGARSRGCQSLPLHVRQSLGYMLVPLSVEHLCLMQPVREVLVTRRSASSADTASWVPAVLAGNLSCRLLPGLLGVLWPVVGGAPWPPPFCPDPSFAWQSGSQSLLVPLWPHLCYHGL